MYSVLIYSLQIDMDKQSIPCDETSFQTSSEKSNSPFLMRSYRVSSSFDLNGILPQNLEKKQFSFLDEII